MYQMTKTSHLSRKAKDELPHHFANVYDTGRLAAGRFSTTFTAAGCSPSSARTAARMILPLSSDHLPRTPKLHMSKAKAKRPRFVTTQFLGLLRDMICYGIRDLVPRLHCLENKARTRTHREMSKLSNSSKLRIQAAIETTPWHDATRRDATRNEKLARDLNSPG
ncbi:hypothetical protein MFRU_006g02470 [Monilinia fructicola]|nr:hypothetical protein MFRU_006g02470 [Monilinia fructicola]